MARAGAGTGLGCLFSLGMFRLCLGNLGNCSRFCAVGHASAAFAVSLLLSISCVCVRWCPPVAARGGVGLGGGASSWSVPCPAPDCSLSFPVSPFLLGRALWAASRFTVAMSPELIQQFLQATVSGLHETQPPSVRISAVRAIWG